MRILLLASAERALDNRLLWTCVARRHELDIRFLDKAQQRNLGKALRGVRLEAYQQVVSDLMFKHVCGQVAFWRRCPALTFYEEDAYLNFMPGSRWLGRFAEFYRRLPGARIICTGAWVTERLRGQGFDAHFVAKGFDPNRLFDRGMPRDLFLGFIGRTGSRAYAQRQALLHGLAAVEPLHQLRTETPAEYPILLNRIRCFVSADIGLGEYMAKNFEAMACGCLLLAKRQGHGEEQALGLVDGDHAFLYDDLADLRTRIDWVRQHPEEAERVARAGHAWVQRNSYPRLAEEVGTILALPFAAPGGVQRPWWKWW